MFKFFRPDFIELFCMSDKEREDMKIIDKYLKMWGQNHVSALAPTK